MSYSLLNPGVEKSRSSLRRQPCMKCSEQVVFVLLTVIHKESRYYSSAVATTPDPRLSQLMMIQIQNCGIFVPIQSKQILHWVEEQMHNRGKTQSAGTLDHCPSL